MAHDFTLSPDTIRFLPAWSGTLRSEEIGGAFHSFSTLIEHMGVDHRRTHVLVPQEFLDGSNFVSFLEEMDGKGMAKVWQLACL